MTYVKTSISIAAKIDDVWDAVMNPRRLGDWVSVHHSLDEVDDGTPRPGFQMRQTLLVAHTRVSVSWTLIESEKPNYGLWEGIGPHGSRGTIIYRLWSEGEQTTVFEYENEFTLPGGILGRLAGQWVGRGLTLREAQTSLHQLKLILEDK